MFRPYYAEPVVAGLDAKGKPFITGKAKYLG
jgi:20S proteasome alpha/beta subunit